MNSDLNTVTSVDSVHSWFAVRTAPRHEKRVHSFLAERRIESYLPLYRTRRIWKKRPPVDLELPLFPSYVFVRIAHETRGRVLCAPGVHSILGNGRQSIPVPDPEIEAIRAGIANYHIEPHPYFAIGERVTIKAGPLAGFSGTLVREKSRSRLVLSIDALMQGMSVEIDMKNIVPFAKDTPYKKNIN